MNHHLAGTKENVIACTSVSDDIKNMFMKLLEDKEKNQRSKPSRLFWKNVYPR